MTRPSVCRTSTRRGRLVLNAPLDLCAGAEPLARRLDRHASKSVTVLLRSNPATAHRTGTDHHAVERWLPAVRVGSVNFTKPVTLNAPCAQGETAAQGLHRRQRDSSARPAYSSANAMQSDGFCAARPPLPCKVTVSVHGESHGFLSAVLLRPCIAPDATFLSGLTSCCTEAVTYMGCCSCR